MTLLTFFENREKETVIFTGSDERRIRIYNRLASQYQNSFASVLTISGLTEEGLEREIETCKNYIAFIIRKA